MQWEKDKAGRYSVSFGAYQAIIQATTGALWKARVIHDGNELLNDSFASLEDAQAWCVTRLAEVRGRT